MPDTINNPVSEVFSRWSKDIQPTVGKGNFSMEKKVLLCTWEKRKFPTPYLGKKVNPKIFHIHHHQKLSKFSKTIINSQQSATALE